MENSFVLVPFPQSEIPEIKISGTIARERNILTVHYLLSGKVGNILFPEPVSQPGRRNELWLATCLEFFIAIPGLPQYWEFNLSPSGEWNAFHIDAYRRVGFREEDRIRELELQFLDEIEIYRMNAVIDLNPIIGSGTHIQAGITAVIQALDRHETYWALAHPRSAADFHIRESFTLLLEDTDYPWL